MRPDQWPDAAAPSRKAATNQKRLELATPKPSAVVRFFRSITGSAWSMIAVLASLAISIVSFKTTFQGMTDYLGAEPPFGLALSFLLTFGVQSLLFIVSWLIAFALFERHILQALSFIGIFLISMGVSVAFSFVDLYDGRTRASGGATDAQEAGRLGRATGLASDTILALREQLDEERNRLFDSFRDQESYQALRDTQQRIQQLAVNPPADIASAFRGQLDAYRSERDGIIAERNQIAVVLNTVDQKTAEARVEKQRLETELAALLDSNQAQREAAEATIVRLEPGVTALERQIQNEIAGRGSRYAETVGRRGCGRVCKELQAELNPVKLELEAAKIVVQTVSEREQTLQTKINELDTRLVELAGRRQELVIASEDTSAGASNGPNAAGAPQVPQGQAPSREDRVAWLEERIALFEGANNPISAISARILSNIDAFEKRQDLVAFDKAIDLCRRAAAMEGGAYINAGRPPAQACPSVQDNPVYSALQGYNVRRASFDTVCGGQTEDGLGQLLARQNSAQDMYGLTSKCIQESGLRGRAVDGLWADLRNKMQRWSPSASKTDKAYTALIEDQETAALVSFTLALIMDSLVLLVAVGGRQMQAVEIMHRESSTDLFQHGMANLSPADSDSMRARSIKLFLRGCHFHPDGSGQVNMNEMNRDDHRLAINTLHMLMANRQAFIRDRNTPSTVTVTKAGHRRLVVLLQQELSATSGHTGLGHVDDARWGPPASDSFWVPRDAAEREKPAGEDPIFRGWRPHAANDANGDAVAARGPSGSDVERGAPAPAKASKTPSPADSTLDSMFIGRT